MVYVPLHISSFLLHKTNNACWGGEWSPRKVPNVQISLEHGIQASEQAATLTGPWTNTVLAQKQFLCHLEQITLCHILTPVFISPLNKHPINEWAKYYPVQVCCLQGVKFQKLKLSWLFERKQINLTVLFFSF